MNDLIILWKPDNFRANPSINIIVYALRTYSVVLVRMTRGHVARPPWSTVDNRVVFYQMLWFTVLCYNKNTDHNSLKPF